MPKELLCRRLSSLRTPDIAVVEFKASPQLLFHCHASEFPSYEFEVRLLRASGSTDLGKAFDELITLINRSKFKNLLDYENIRVLVISDGLTNSTLSD